MSIYVTRDGLALIKQEFNDIWTNIRPEVTKKLAWAASLGDRSENADYQYNKKLLREIDIYIKKRSDIIRDAEGKQIIDNATSIPEHIEIPERYQNKSNWKTKTFAKRLVKRLHPVQKPSSIE